MKLSPECVVDVVNKIVSVTASIFVIRIILVLISNSAFFNDAVAGVNWSTSNSGDLYTRSKIVCGEENGSWTSSFAISVFALKSLHE